ncbi:hypothetical protein [Methanosalsum natronophilum]|uniref:ArsR family transcriptional regulator n=1 Tax=Methanosalsum natronophilum TaxID=768733 RepID=A0A3R8CD09_9EURY|nr:hypothetical protein [Methanosalsum natronophilum]MCS3923491.1 transcription initiation factor IIE alpha subunit [Methanosalsum natronophilum]RQD86549.1 MAG: ArsR family transcriptional regulator [Methanosalsum natronophilum]
MSKIESRDLSGTYKNNIENMPPSSKLVYKVLEYKGFLTPKQIATESQLPPRTVRYALSRLKDENFLLEKFCFKDARQSLYGIKDKHHSSIKATVNS